MNAGRCLGIFFALGVLGLATCAIRKDRLRTIVIGTLALLQSTALAACGFLVLIRHEPIQLQLWRLGGIRLSLYLAPLGSLFVVITAIVFASCYSFAATSRERKTATNRSANRSFLALFQLFYLAIVLVIAAGDLLTFAFWWEVVSGLIYGFVLFEHENTRALRAAYSALAMSEVGSIAGIVGLLMLAGCSGHLTFAAIAASRTPCGEATRWLIFLLTFYGFGVKAGLVPVNQWLVETYTASPRSFSPVLAGAASNLGLYAILLVNTALLPVNHVGMGLTALLSGGLGAIIGIVYAATQSNLKRALAHSSIENMGIIIAGIGAGFIFWQTGHATLAGIAFVAALYHMINHSISKSMLFLGAGTVEETTGTHDLNQLGGLLKRLPIFGLFFLVGTLSISAVPPFNGFVSEWLTLQSVLRSVELSSRTVRLCFVFTGALLALAAGLALTCFLMIYASGFLGMPHSDAAQRARRAPRSAVWGMGALAILCLLLGVGPTYVIPSLDRVVSPITHTRTAYTLVPNFFHVTPQSPGNLSPGFVSDFHDLGAQVGGHFLPGRGLVVLHQGGSRNPVVFAISTAYTLAVLILLLALIYIVFRFLTRARHVQTLNAWAGGLPKLLPQMTYNFTGLSAPVRVIFETVFRPLQKRTIETVGGHFRTSIRVEETQEHVLDRTVTQPVLAAFLWIANHFRKMHRGEVNVYAAYVLLSLIAVLIIGVAGF